jgi:hypothetical protein
MRPGDKGVGVIDADDAPVQSMIGDEAAGGLDLGEFWHAPVLLASGPLTRVPAGIGVARRRNI